MALGIKPRMRNTILGSNRMMAVASLPAPPERVIDWFSVVLRALTKARDRVVVVTIPFTAIGHMPFILSARFFIPGDSAWKPGSRGWRWHERQTRGVARTRPE